MNQIEIEFVLSFVYKTKRISVVYGQVKSIL